MIGILSRLLQKKPAVLPRAVSGGVPVQVSEYRETVAWRHLDTCSMRTCPRAALPNVTCPKHGKQTLCPPWAGQCLGIRLVCAQGDASACRGKRCGGRLLNSWKGSLGKGGNPLIHNRSGFICACGYDFSSNRRTSRKGRGQKPARANRVEADKAHSIGPSNPPTSVRHRFGCGSGPPCFFSSPYPPGGRRYQVRCSWAGFAVPTLQSLQAPRWTAGTMLRSSGKSATPWSN